ncbi:MAG: lipid biosynthesis B12-binding/radical SAM protein [Lentisphaeria bacterium]|jgi:radical SAM superfamily enzyme YgiQ (UPF0313 family)|nr:lipid biosynthesis B12-binding/radical SAM protein [Lentisphaeria bacterium]
MSRVLLVSTNLCTIPYAVFPLGMATVAGALARAGHEVRQFDLLAADGEIGRYVAALQAWGPDVVCLSIRNLDSTDSLNPQDDAFLDSAEAVVAATRRAGTWPVIIGGPAVSILPEEVLAYTGADHAVVGEGEQTLCLLLDELAAGRRPAPILRANNLLPAAALAPPLYDLDLARHYVERSGLLGIQTKRGCPFHCAYCTYPHLEGRHYRQPDPGEVVDRMEQLQRDAGAQEFFFTDSVMNDPGRHYLGIAEELLRRAAKLRWAAFFTPHQLPREDLAVCKRSGLYAVELGTDAASDATLAGMHKPFDFAQVRAANEACVAERIPVSHFVIFGGPGETHATVREGMANLDGLDHCVVLATSGVRILPGSPLHQQAIDEGMIAADTPLLRPVTYVSPQVDAEWLNHLVATAWEGRHDRIFPASRDNHRLQFLQSIGMRGVIWDKLIRY